MRIFFEKMVLNFPGKIVAEAIGQFDLVERILIEVQFAIRLPRARQLQLIKYTEFHRLLLRARFQAAPRSATSWTDDAQSANRFSCRSLSIIR
jgi:hypothetical protein